MATDDRMPGVQQENVLTLLCFNTEAALTIKGMVKPELFDSRVYQDIAVHAIAFIEQYGEAIKDHLPDLIEDQLNDKDKRKASLYRRTLENVYAAKDGINAEFVLRQLRDFVHLQTLKGAILKAVDRIEQGKTAEAEVVLTEGLNSQVVSFDVGTSFMDTTRSLSFFDRSDDGIPTGIDALDRAGIMPSRGTQFVFIAPAKKGKSWFLTHVGKTALLQRHKVLVVTLEMSESTYSMRFVQSLFSFSKREDKIVMPRFRTGENGTFAGIEMTEIERPALSDKGARAVIEKRIKQNFKNRMPLVIKAFPTSTLTVAQYEAYLDQLERLHKFVPDIVLFDYPDLMQVDSTNQRLEVGGLFRSLRGIAVKRNHALVTPTQGNRQSAESRTTLDTHVAEDYSKIATADIVVTYSQTAEEKRLGLARLFVSNARADEDKFTVLITQNYKVGQFALDSMRMGGDYWSTLDKSQGKPEVDDAKDDK